MATVTKSIGTTGRDYSTMTLWEADLDDSGIYSAADDAVGECYNDSDFDEGPTFNGGSTIGLTSFLVTVADTERHNGTANTGVRNLYTGTKFMGFGPGSVISGLSWMEVDGNDNWSGNTSNGIVSAFSSSSALFTAKNCIVHSVYTGANAIDVHGLVSGWFCAQNNINCIVYNVIQAHSTLGQAVGLGGRASTKGTCNQYNCTVHNIDSNESGRGVFQDQSGYTTKNCVATDCSHLCFNISTRGSNNASSDSTATNTNDVPDIVTADQYLDTSDPPDLHLKAGSDCIDAGTDLATTPSGVEIDIDGRDRDAEGDTWDIGAHEFVAAGGGPEDLILQRHRTNTLTLR